MANYTIVLSKNAQKTLDKLSDHIAQPILDAIADLEQNPKPIGCKNLKGRKGNRIRVGDYRVIYDVIDTEFIVDVIAIGHRKNIYK